MKERLRLLSEHDRHVAETAEALQAQREHLREKIAWYQEQLGVNTDEGSGGGLRSARPWKTPLPIATLCAR